jgi:ketosteroid isomerase-like protein
MSLDPTHKQVMLDYLAAFTEGDLGVILQLFAPEAWVYSPTQDQPRRPIDFYPALLERSKGTVFTPKTCFAGDQPGTAAILFDYHKKMPDGSIRPFDCVDLFAFDAQGKIRELRIIFDTKKLG